MQKIMAKEGTCPLPVRPCLLLEEKCGLPPEASILKSQFQMEMNSVPQHICAMRETVGFITLGGKKTNKGVSGDLSETSGSGKTYVATY